MVISKAAQEGSAPVKNAVRFGAQPPEILCIDLKFRRLCSQNSYNIK